MQFEGKPPMPIGAASALGKSKETLPTVEVKNEVIWVNSNLDFPFPIEKNKPTKLGLFLAREHLFKKVFNFADDQHQYFEAEKHHGRSLLLGRIIMSGKNNEGQAQLFRDIDIKGIGYVLQGHGIGKPLPAFDENEPSVRGVLNKDDALYDAEVSEILNSSGVRVVRTIAIIELEEMVVGGRKVSVENLKRKRIIPKNIHPVLSVRAFPGTHARLIDVIDNKGAEAISEEKRNLYLQDAKKLVAEELGIEVANFSDKDYFVWLAATLGENIALMHNQGYRHKYLSPHNITLDGYIVDFDAAEQLNPHQTRGFAYDFTDAKNTLKYFCQYFGLSDLEQEKFFLSYKSAYDEARQEYSSK